MYSAIHESGTVLVSRNRRIRTTQRINQIAGFVTLPKTTRFYKINAREYKSLLKKNKEKEYKKALCKHREAC